MEAIHTQQLPEGYSDTGCCLWTRQSALWIAKPDNPGFCQYIPEKESAFCQKHGMIVAEVGSEYKD